MAPFFDLPEPVQKSRRRRRRKRTDNRPEEPPALLLPGYLGGDFVLAASDEAAVIVRRLACYPNGFSFSLRAIGRYWDDEEIEDPTAPFLRHARRGEVPPTMIRFGIAFSDGSKATTLDADAARPWSDHDRPGVKLVMRSGGGGGLDFEYAMWAFPLPPDGPVTFACEWPAFGIPETTRRIDGARFHKAAAKAKPVF